MVKLTGLYSVKQKQMEIEKAKLKEILKGFLMLKDFVMVIQMGLLMVILKD